MRCRYCGCEIIWTETQGWVREHFGTILWGTVECSSRPNPAQGHALTEEESSNETAPKQEQTES